MSNTSDNKESVLTAFFESREENLYSLTEKDKEKVKNLTKNNNSYEKLFGVLENLSNTPQNLEIVICATDNFKLFFELIQFQLLIQ